MKRLSFLRTMLAAAAAFASIVSWLAPAHAADIVPNTWTEHWDTIVSVSANDDELVITLAQDRFACSAPPCGVGCNDGRQFYVARGEPNYELKAATLHAAYLSGREVMILWDTNTTCRAHINRFQVRVAP